MQNTLSEIMLRANTALFAQKVSRTFEQMIGTRFEIQAKSLVKGYYKSTGSFVAFMHFAGGIQGDFIITSEENAIESILKSALKDQIDFSVDKRTVISDFISEILNIASGQTIAELEKKYGNLILVPPATVYGELRLAEVLSGNVDILNALGTIRCTVSLNLASLKAIDTKN